MNYCLYTKQIGEIIKHNTKCQCYVDDNLVYTPFKSLDKWDDSSSSVEDCTANINIWIDSKIMKLNKDKNRIPCFLIHEMCKENAGSSYIIYSMSVINHRLILDKTLCMEN